LEEVAGIGRKKLAPERFLKILNEVALMALVKVEDQPEAGIKVVGE
jgi:hypothetical protein